MPTLEEYRQVLQIVANDLQPGVELVLVETSAGMISERSRWVVIGVGGDNVRLRSALSSNFNDLTIGAMTDPNHAFFYTTKQKWTKHLLRLV